MTTRRAQLGRREEPIQFKLRSSIPARFVIKFSEDLGERRIREMLGKIVILEHPGDVQPFDKDRLVLADELRREFLNRLSPGVADSGLELSHFELGFLPILAALDLAGETTLKLLPSLFSSRERARVFESLSVAGRGEGLHADVSADLGFDLFNGRTS